MNNTKSSVVFTIIWYVIFAALIYFVNFSILNYICLLLGMLYLTTSIIYKETGRIILKIVLEIALFVVYYFRPY